MSPINDARVLSLAGKSPSIRKMWAKIQINFFCCNCFLSYHPIMEPFSTACSLSLFFGGRCSYRCRFRTKTQTHEDRECVFSLLNSPKMVGHKAMNHTKKATHALTKVDKKIRSQCSNFTTFVYNCQSKICLSSSLTAKTELVFVEVFLLVLLSLVFLIRCHGLCWRSLFSASILLANGMCMWLFLKSVIPFL